MKKIRRGINWFLIVLFFTLGFIGLLLPLIPQFLFFAIGIIILSFEVPRFADYIEKALTKYPKVLKLYHLHRTKFEKYFK